MSNTWKNSNNIVDIINKQAKMVELTRMGDKIVLLDIGDEDYVSNKTIKTNKLVWRSIWSYLDNDTTDLIYKSIIMDNMKSKVLQIKRWPVRAGYVCNLQFNSLGHTAQMSYKSNREMDSKLEKCIFLKKNGKTCGKVWKDRIYLKDDYEMKLLPRSVNNNLSYFGVGCCGTHKNQYKKLSESAKINKTIEILDTCGYRLKHGIMCKV